MSPLLALLVVHGLASPTQAPDSIGDGGPAAAAVLRAPEGVAVDGEGHVYVSERAGHRVRRIDARTGVITTFAGTGRPGYAGDGGPAGQAMLALPTDVAVDARGDLYIAEPANHRIRVVDGSNGVITTFAGTGEAGFRGDGGPATEARLRSPFGVSVAPDGSVYISDTDNHRIRRVDPVTGVIETVAGDGTPDFGGDGGPATAASLARPHRVVVDADGTVYVGDSFNHRIRRVDARTGVITTLAGTGRMGGTGDGGPATEASLTYSGGLLLDGRGGLLYTDQATHRIRRIDLVTGLIRTVAGTGRWDFGGDGGPALEADFHLPGSMALDPAGALLVVDKWNGRVRRVDLAADRVETLAGSRLNEPTPEVSYHFHHDEGDVRRRLDAPVAATVPDPGEVEVTRLEFPSAGRAEPVGVALYAPRDRGGADGAPLVLLLHGRANHPVDPLAWLGLASWGRLLAGRGMAAAVISHRLGSAPRSLDRAAADVTAARAGLASRADALGVDPGRFCLVAFDGASTLVTRDLRQPPEGLRCTALFSPHLDVEPPALWAWYMEDPATRARHAPATALTAASPPLFVAVGEGAPAALTEPLDALVDRAGALGVTLEVARHPSGGPGFERLLHDDHSRRIVERALAFLERNLRRQRGGALRRAAYPSVHCRKPGEDARSRDSGRSARATTSPSASSGRGGS